MGENNVPEYNNKRTDSQPCQTLSTLPDPARPSQLPTANK